MVTVRRVVLELPRKFTGAACGCTFRDYPKDNEYREIAVGANLSHSIKAHMLKNGRRDDDLLFSTAVGTPTFEKHVPHAGVAPGCRSVGPAPACAIPRPARRARLLAAGGRRRSEGSDGSTWAPADPTTHQAPGSLPDAGDRALRAFEAVRTRQNQ